MDNNITADFLLEVAKRKGFSIDKSIKTREDILNAMESKNPYTDLPDKELFEKASSIGVAITEKMTRKEVEVAVCIKEHIDSTAKKNKDVELKNKDIIQLKYISNSSFSRAGIKYQKNQVVEVSTAESIHLLTFYPQRFIKVRG